MKKSLLALAVLGAYAGVASAQSSVTLYGTVDLAGTYVKNDGSDRRFSLSQDGINSSQLGFRGIEDLGGGLKAGFTLLAGVNADTGTTNSKFFNRRSTVSLFSGAGELRFGRDYTPTFWNMTTFDAFGTNGLGSSLNTRLLYNGTRADNTIGYFLPSNIGGFYGQVMAAASEGGTEADRPARYISGRIGFAAGPFDIAGAYGTQKFRATYPIAYPGGSGPTGFVTIPSGEDQKTWNVGGSYDLGFMKLLGYYNHDKVDDLKESMFSVSAVLPFGQSEIHVGWDHDKLSGFGDSYKLNQYKATYQYNLSKRTAMYFTGSFLKNDGASRQSVAGGSAITAYPTGGEDSKGGQLGVRHFF